MVRDARRHVVCADQRVADLEEGFPAFSVFPQTRAEHERDRRLLDRDEVRVGLPWVARWHLLVVPDDGDAVHEESSDDAADPIFEREAKGHGVLAVLGRGFW